VPPPSRITATSLRVRALAAEDAEAVDGFVCGDVDLDDFLRTDALRLQRHHVARTYLAFLDGQLVGYMTLLADAVGLETRERKRLALSSTDHPSVPALKIARLAVGREVRLERRGAGTALVAIAYAMALDLADRVGCRLLTVDAYPESVPFYERLGFVTNRAKPYQGRTHPSMRLDVFPPTPPAWLA
jgi:GNAT superfamily N-acetyltransferase